jgi:TetR/AcrR family transcriptional regulator
LGLGDDGPGCAARAPEPRAPVYFQDKTDLHLALVERALATLAQRFTTAIAGRASGLDSVEAIGHAYVAYARELPHYFDACARFQAHRTETGELAPNEVACAEAGHRVHEIMVDALNRGVADGSIRRDLGDPWKTAITLWALTYGILQLSATKGPQFEHQGIAVPALIEHAFGFALRALATTGARS